MRVLNILLSLGLGAMVWCAKDMNAATTTETETTLQPQSEKEPFYERYEIRVIREKYFQKRFRINTDISLGTALNNPFKHTYSGELNVGFHFNEYIGLEVFGSGTYLVGGSTYTSLKDTFGILPESIENPYSYGGNILLTPIYGKAISTYRFIVYFDTFIVLGGGAGSLKVLKLDNNGVNSTNSSTSSYYIQADNTPFINIGIGQRYYITENISLRINLIDSLYIYKSSSLETTEEQKVSIQEENQLFHNFHATMGLSYFF